MVKFFLDVIANLDFTRNFRFINVLMPVFLRIEPFDTKKHVAFVLVIHNGIRLYLIVTIVFELFPANRGVKVSCPHSAVPVKSTWRELTLHARTECSFDFASKKDGVQKKDGENRVQISGTEHIHDSPIEVA